MICKLSKHEPNSGHICAKLQVPRPKNTKQQIYLIIQEEQSGKHAQLAANRNMLDILYTGREVLQICDYLASNPL